MMATSTETGDRQDTKRLEAKKQTLDDAYAAPANFLEIDVVNPETHGVGKKRYTDYEVRMRVGTLLIVQMHFVRRLTDFITLITFTYKISSRSVVLRLFSGNQVWRFSDNY